MLSQNIRYFCLFLKCLKKCCFCPDFFLCCFHGPQLIDRVPNELKNQDFLLHLKPWKSSKTCRTFGTYTKLQPGLKLSKLFSWGRNNHFGVVMILIIFCLFPLAQIGYDPHCPKLPKLPAHPQEAHTSPILKTSKSYEILSIQYKT